MIAITDKAVKSFIKIIKNTNTSYWNLLNPETGEKLKSSDLKKRGEPYFTSRPDSWDAYGVIDVGTDFDHVKLWLTRIEKYFEQGFYLCAGGDNAICDLKNMGYSTDEKGAVIHFGR